MFLSNSKSLDFFEKMRFSIGYIKPTDQGTYEVVTQIDLPKYVEIEEDILIWIKTIETWMMGVKRLRERRNHDRVSKETLQRLG